MTSNTPSGNLKDPAAVVKWPALLMLIVGILYIVVGLVAVLGNAFVVSRTGKAIMNSESYSEAQFCYGVMGGALSVVFGAAMVLGGTMLKRFRNRSLVTLGAICALLPCSCCFLIGLPIGIWVLVVMGRPEVKGAFR